ncbi:MAG: hypothetical protein HZB91_09640 [Elusimicrobia bacterium]|nr:hypothetical protein [Elusimicrobiota bacterium]
MAYGSVAVFEAVNATLKEFYIGVSPLAFDEVERRLRERPPEPISHWRSDQDISYRCVEPELGLKQSAAFLEVYADTISKIGWKAILA